MILIAVENQINWFPELKSGDLPNSLPSTIKLHLKGNILGIEPEGVVGAIPLSNGDTLHIEPKIGKTNFLKLLFKAQGNQADLQKSYDQLVNLSTDKNSQGFESLISRQLLISITEILHRGLNTTRVKRNVSEEHVTGQLNPLLTALSVAMKARKPIKAVIKQKSHDTHENHVLTVALRKAWKYLADTDKERFLPSYNKWMRNFGEIRFSLQDVQYVEGIFAAEGYGGARGYYRQALTAALVILGNDGLGFNGKADVLGDSVLMNTASVFEKYVRNVVAEKLYDKGYVVSKGGNYSTLYVDGSVQISPDLVISKSGSIKLIADAKYKSPSANDHYQMVAYLQTKGVKSGVLIAPLLNGTEPVIKEYLTPTGLKVRELYLPMANLPLVEDLLGQVVDLYSN